MTAVGSPGTSSLVSTENCTPCILLQTASDGVSPTYALPSGGVISQYVFFAGSSADAGATARLQVYRPGGGGTFTLVGESTAQTYLATDSQQQVAARVTVQAGDVLGMRFDHTNANTPRFSAGAAGDTTGDVSGTPALGDIVNPASTSPRKLNVGAFVEPDSDGDGYGDESQDLCINDATEAADACTGTLVGSLLQGSATSGHACGTPPCSFIQSSLPGRTTEVPFDGVVLRWRFKDGDFGNTHRLKVFRPTGAPNQYTAVAESDPVDYAGNNTIARGNTRIGVRAGDLLGWSGTGGFKSVATAGAAGRTTGPDPGIGTTGGAPVDGGGFEYLYNADVEPDADHDLWGDLSEDGCTTNAARRDDCVAPAVGGPSLSNTRFTIDSKGAVIARGGAKKGTTISLTLGEAAATGFVVEKAQNGRRVGASCRKQAKSNKRKRKCTRYVKVHVFERALPVGATSIAYSGRYKKAAKKKTLAAGNYRLVVTATDANGNSTTADPAKFTVARAAK